MFDLLRQMFRRPRFEVELVGLYSGNRYPWAFTQFHNRQQGQEWCEERNRSMHPATRWELVER